MTAFAMGGIAALLAGACVAPVLIAVLLLSGSLYAKGSALGIALPFILGLGMALPWPFAAAGLSFLPKPGAWMNWIKRGFGVLILLMALHYGRLGFGLINRADASSQGNQRLAAELASAYAAKQSVLLDFGAEWCKNCKAMDADTFPNAAVKRRLEKYRFIKVDATEPDQPPAAEIIKYFNVQGLPTFVILRPL